MTEFYDDMAATAADLIAEFGQAVTLTRVAQGEYDEATGTAGTTTSTQPCLAVEEAYKAREIDGTLIQAGDKRLMLSPQTSAGATVATPQAGDTVTFSGDVNPWTVKSVEPLSPGGTALLYTLQLRRS